MTLVNIQKNYGTSQLLMGKSTISKFLWSCSIYFCMFTRGYVLKLGNLWLIDLLDMVIIHSYVGLPEGH